MEEPAGNEEETTVRVAVRCRPFNSKEKANGETSCVKIRSDQVVLVNPSNPADEHSFAFDLVIDENATQESVWLNVGVPILSKAFNGYNGTIFAYGQTGSGKTWSMQGADGPDLEGIIPRMNNQLFQRVETEVKKRPTIQFLITVSYFEIYNEVIFDLLDSSDRKKRSAKGGLEIKEHPVLGVYVKGLQELVVDSAAKLQSIIDQGMRNRTVASTQMNADSSRSHSVFIINLHQKDTLDESKNVFAKVNLVDLAGSERVKSTGATGSILKEGANINKSLSALGNVINALVEASKGKGTFIPYRNSKLTRVLQESLGGNSITAMLAALSPAACNFEETLSTLKYANRAKAIKVKAVKNEQSSQISKLNDEIRALKEKLLSQGGGGSGPQDGQDASALDEKNRQRLRDLEEAMRSTWEAKSKMSEEYERERQALLVEQQNAARQFEAARQRNWALLEQKSDLDTTLGHVRTLVPDRLAQSPVAALLGRWGDALKDVAALERRLGEQDTVIQVYRSSLDRDSQALVQQHSHCTRDKQVTFDGAAASMLRQLREKVGGMCKEMPQWTGLQDELLERIQQAVEALRNSGSARATLQATAKFLADALTDPATGAAGAVGAGVLSKDERRELHRGLSMLRRQLTQKHRQVTQSVAASRKTFVAFDAVRLDLVKLLSVYDSATAPGNLLGAAAEGAEQDPAAAEIVQALAAQAKAMRTKLESGASRLVEIFDRLERVMKDSAAATSPGLLNDTAVPADRSSAPSPSELGDEVPVDNVTLQDCAPELIFAARPSAQAVGNGRVASDSAAVMAIDSPQNWACSLSRFGDNGSLVLALPRPQLVTALQLQGGMVPGDIPASSSAAPTSTAAPTPPVALSGEALITSIALPCGLTLATVEPHHELTSAALADVFDWSALIKSNPPEKFLKRPPVRFLFDLVKFVGAGNSGFLSEDLDSADWAAVGADKASKLEFMEKLIEFTTQRVFATQPVTTAAAIVTGSDPELTNILLQQLAIALYAFQTRPETGTPLPGSAAGSKPAVSVVPKVVTHESWVTAVRVEGSADADRWQRIGEFPTGLNGAHQVVTIPLVLVSSGLRGSPGTLSASASATMLQPTPTDKFRYLRLTPIKWNGEGRFGPAMRAALLAPETYSDDENASGSEAVGPLASPLPAGALVEVVEALQGTLSVLVEAVEFVSKREDAARELKQLEVKRNFENLAKDKLALETLLANEKRSLESNNQDLEERLKACVKQLQDTQLLLEREQKMNEQLERSRSEAEAEKASAQKALVDKEEENGQLRATILSLQASLEKERGQCEQIQERLADSEKSMETLQDQLQQAEEARLASEHEREELLSQIAVLTEERDSARAQEEELFEKLTERTQDLDRLRESYVEITDRWNDAQDENMDLRDKVESLQSALEVRSSLHAASPAVSYQPPALFSAAAVPTVASPKAEVDGAQASPRAVGAKATKAVPPSGDGRAKASPRGTSSGHQYVATMGGDNGSMLSADGKGSVDLPFSGASPPAREAKVAVTTGGAAGVSPRNPPPAPVASHNSDYADDYGDDYEEEFETDD